MKTLLAWPLIVALMLLVGCASTQKGPAFGQERKFRQQLTNSIPVTQLGYTFQDVRFTKDYKEAFAIFVHADSAKKPVIEVILKPDGFGRYRGQFMQPFYTPGTANTPGHLITVDLGGN